QLRCFSLYFSIGFLVMMFVPQRMKLIQAELVRQPLRCVGTGFLGVLAYAVLMLLSIITIVGPFVLALVALVLWAMGMVALALELGARLPMVRGRTRQAAVRARG